MLNDQQQKALDEIFAFIKHPSEVTHVLSGIAGSGKTYLLAELLKQFPEFKKKENIKLRKVVFTATTNKAVQALNLSLNENATTVHSYLGLRLSYDYKLKKNKLYIGKADKAEQELIVVDEYSYIDEDLYKMVIKQTHKCKILFVGDSYQLPPVGATSSYIDNLVCGRSELTKVMRQSDGNPIQALSIAMRESIRKGTPFPEIQFNDHIKKLPLREFQQSIIDDIESGANFKHLAFKNATVQHYNNNMHKLSTKQSNVFNVGDLLEINQFIKSSNDVSLSTNSIHSIDAIEPSTFMGFSGYKIVLNDEEFFLSDDVTAKEKAVANTDDYFELKHINSYWVDARHAYSCTIHKSQGATFDRIYIHNPDFINVKQFNFELFKRLLYVAFSRARHEVIFIG